MKLSSIVFGAALVLAAMPAAAQSAGAVCGRTLRTDGSPLAAVTVRSGAGGAATDSLGRFCLAGVPAGTVRLEARRLDLVALTREVRVTAGDTTRVELRMGERSLELPAVVVTARESGTGTEGSTTSRLDRSAIDHLQASSLADVLQLVPGQTAGNPTLASAQQSLIRQAAAGGDAARANALGTAVVVDGVPLSNNANLQSDVTILNSAPGALPAFSSVAGRGVDLRQIPADEVESVEVVRGIPSARHGDLTAGAILVETRAGARRPEGRLRINPTTLDGSFGAGWGDGVTRSGWSASMSLAAAADDPRDTRGSFERGTVQLAWTRPWAPAGRAATTLRLNFFSTLDERRQDPDDLRYQRVIRARDRGVRGSLSGFWRPAGDRPTRLSWTAGAAFSGQTGFQQELVTRSDLFPQSTATRDTTQPGSFGRTEYLSQVTVDGRPLNLYGRVEAAHTLSRAGWTHRGVLGAEGRFDANLGAGRQFDPAAPPRQNYSVGDRPRSYREVPGVAIASAYAEDRVSGRIAGRPAEVQAGVRFDNVAPTSPLAGRFGSVLAPRLNASVEVAPELRLRAGYGVAAKAPPLAYLYPGPRYFDLVNFSHYAADPAERLVIVTTRRVDPSNENARVFRATKAEAGMEWRRGGWEATAVLFRERTSGAYGWTRRVAAFPVEKYGIASRVPGAPPVLAAEPMRVDTFLGAYDAPAATRRIDTRGAELTLELPEWAALRTSASLNGGWVRTRAEDGAVSIDTEALFRAAAAPARIAIRSADGYAGDRFTTSARLIHRAPELGLVISGLAQTVWWERERRTGGSPNPTGYVTRGGEVVMLTPAEAASEAYAELRRTLGEGYLAEERRPPLWLFNLRMSKTLPAGLQMSFYVNNVLADRPLYLQRRTGGYEQRNPPLFFGVELVSAL